jgi:hypothetical protein
MNIRRLPLNTDFFTVTTTEPNVASQPFGYEPSFQAVGRPWRYEFPHQPSTSDPDAQPRFTVQAPVAPVLAPVVLAPVVLAPVQVPESATTPPSASPPAADPADQSQKVE